MVDNLKTSCQIALIRMTVDLLYDKPTLFRVMARYRSTGITWTKFYGAVSLQGAKELIQTLGHFQMQCCGQRICKPRAKLAGFPKCSPSSV